MQYIVGLDLGQAADYSALAVLECTGGAFDDPPDYGEKRYGLVHLERWPLGTSYPAIIADVRGLLERRPLAGMSVPLITDQTGCGRPVCDMFRASGLPAIGITLTGGTDPNLADPVNLKLPKRQLVSVLVAAFQGQRLKIADTLELAPTLIHELSTFRIKINLNTTNETFEAWRERDHDDTVLAVGLATWYGEEYFQPFVYAAAGEFRLPVGYRLEG
jgi:hypothetical protein